MKGLMTLKNERVTILVALFLSHLIFIMRNLIKINTNFKSSNFPVNNSANQLQCISTIIFFFNFARFRPSGFFINKLVIILIDLDHLR